MGACFVVFFFFQAEDGIRDFTVTGVQTCALPILPPFRAGSLICAQISPSVLPSHAISIGARCHSGWPGMLSSPPACAASSTFLAVWRSEERRVGKECRSRWGREHEKKDVSDSAAG